jgi:hypothetical protein
MPYDRLRKRRDALGRDSFLGDGSLSESGLLFIGEEDLAPEFKPWWRHVANKVVGLYGVNDQVVFGARATTIPHARDKWFVDDQFPAAGNVGGAFQSSTGKAYLRFRGDVANDTYRHALSHESDRLTILYGEVDDPDSMSEVCHFDSVGNLLMHSADPLDVTLASQAIHGIKIRKSAASTNRPGVVAEDDNNAAKAGFFGRIGTGANNYNFALYQTTNSFFINLTNNTTALDTSAMGAQMNQGAGTVTWYGFNTFTWRDSGGADAFAFDADNERFKLFDQGSANYVGLKPPGTLAASWDMTLPTGAGTNLYFLMTDGSGNTSWSQVDLTGSVTGVLPIANGGTNASSFGTSGGVAYYDGTRLVNSGNLTFDGTTLQLTGFLHGGEEADTNPGFAATFHSFFHSQETATALGKTVELSIFHEAVPASNSNHQYAGIESWAKLSGGAVNHGGVGVGINGSAWNNATGTTDELYGVLGFGYHATAGTLTDMAGVRGNFEIDAGTVTNAYGVAAAANVYIGGSATNVATFYSAGVPSGISTTVTNAYGLKIEDVLGGSNNWAIHTGSGLVVLGDRVRIGASTAAVAANDFSVGDTTDYIFFDHSLGELRFVGDTGILFGEIYVKGNSATTTVNSTGGKVQVTVFNTNGESNGATPDHTNDHITIDTAGRYEVTVSISVKNSSGAAHTINFGLFKNNGATQYNNVHTSRTLGTGSDVGSMGMHGICDFAATDTVEVWVNTDSASDRDITIEDITLTVEQVGG